MKTNLRFMLLMAIAIYADAGFGQETYVFQNFRISPALDAPVFDFAGNRLSGTNFVAQLYGGPTTDSLTPATFGLGTTPAIVPFTAIHNGQAGYFSGNTYATITNVFCGTGLLWLEVRAWDARLGGNYEDMASLGIGGFGASSLFEAAGGTPCGLPIPPGLL